MFDHCWITTIYNHENAGHSSNNFRDGHIPIHIRQASCSGAEFRLLDCSYRMNTDTECNQHEDSGVICSLGII